jgi:hypothetical protein
MIIAQIQVRDEPPALGTPLPQILSVPEFVDGWEEISLTSLLHGQAAT